MPALAYKEDAHNVNQVGGNNGNSLNSAIE